MKKVKRNKLVASAMILGIATGSVITLPFSHASLTAYAADAVSTESDAIKQVRELGLMTGGTQGDFMADKVLTRAETAKILSLIFQLDTSPQQMTSFMDVSSTAWSASYIEAVREAGFMGGDGELFRPNDAVTRADLISILVRSMELHGDDSSVDAQTPVDIARSYGLSVVEASEDLNAPLNREHGAEFFLQLLDHPVGEVVTDGNTVRIGNIPYQIGSTLQGLLGVENGNVLKGAKLDLNRSLRTVTGINTLELNGNGGTLDGAGATFNGKIIINGSVTVKNLTSTGELEIRGTDSVEAILDNSSLSKVTIIAKDAKLTATGTTRLEQLALDSNATLLTQGEAFINRLSLLQGLSKLFINGTIGELDTTGYNGTPFITLQERALIQQLRLDPNKLPSDVVINYNVMKQAVSGLNGNANPDQTQVVTPPDTSSSRPKPNNGNNGNNGGGNSGNESPAVDRVVLETTITHAGSLLNRAGEGGPDRNLYLQEAKDSLGSAIELAIGVLNNNQANQAAVNEAVLQLNTAIQNYLGSAVQQGLIDLTALDQQLRISTESMLPENDNELPRVWNDYLQMAILDAQQVLVNSNTTQADVDAATTQLAKKSKLYMASLSIKLPALQLLNAINSLPDLDFTDADRFKPTAFQAMLVYANTASSLEELQMTASQVQAMYDEYLLIQSVNFKALNVKLHEVGELTELHPADVVLSDMLNFYTKKMHKAMTQPEVDGILHELTSKLSNWSDINNPGEQVDTMALSQLVNTIAESLNSEPYLSSIMPLEYQTMDSLLSNSIDMYQPGSTSSQKDIDQQYTALEQGYFLFKEQLADKKLDYRHQLNLLIQQADDLLITQSGNMSPQDENYLNVLLLNADQAAQIDSPALFILFNAVTDLSNGLEQVQILDKATLLTILDQAKADYDAYGKYHPSGQTLYMAIENANTELADGYITQESIDEARLSLADALDNFQSPWITQMMIDDTLEQAILLGDQYSSGAESESQEYIALVTAIFEMQSLEDAESFEATLSQYVALKKSIEEFEVFLSNQGSNNSGGIPGDDPGVPFTSDEAVQSTDNPPADPVNPTPPVEESSQGDDNVTGENDGASNSEVPSEPEISEPETTEPEATEPIQDGSEPAVENSNENSNAPEANPADQDAEQGAEQEQGIPGGDSDFGIPG